MKNYSKPVSITAKIIEVILFTGAGLLLVGIIASFFSPGLLGTWEGTLNVLGLTVTDMAGISDAALRVILLYGVVGLALYGMIARSIHLIAGSLIKKDAFCEENTPFTKDITRMVREIGIFTIAFSLAGSVFGWIVMLMETNAEVVSNNDGIMMGLVVLYLSTIFNYGVHLQKDVEGLV